MSKQRDILKRPGHHVPSTMSNPGFTTLNEDRSTGRNHSQTEICLAQIPKDMKDYLYIYIHIVIHSLVIYIINSIPYLYVCIYVYVYETKIKHANIFFVCIFNPRWNMFFISYIYIYLYIPSRVSIQEQVHIPRKI